MKLSKEDTNKLMKAISSLKENGIEVKGTEKLKEEFNNEAPNEVEVVVATPAPEQPQVSMLVVLNSLLRVYASNFSVLHWNSIGEEFNDAHRNIAGEYEELCSKYVDVTAEMATRLGVNPLNYAEVLDLFNNSDRQCLIVDSKKFYTRKDIIVIADKLFTDITSLIAATIESEELQAPINAGIRSELESILNDFDLQYRYINKRRLAVNNAE